MYSEIIKETTSLMDKAMESLQGRFKTVRAGRANPSSLDGVLVSTYGMMMPINQVATVSVPEARQLLIKPFDRSTLGAIEKAIFEANLGFTPNNDGETIRIIIPPLTEERRRELTKQVKAMAEDSKVSIRNIRRDSLEKVDKLEASEDEKKRGSAEVQDLVNKYNKKIEDVLAEKEKELLSV